MYKLIFDSDQFIELPIKAMKIGLAKWDGSSKPPRYLWIWIKEKYINKESKVWETLFYHRKFIKIEVYSEETSELVNTIPVPTPRVDFHYEEGDIIVDYGDSLYSDDAY